MSAKYFWCNFIGICGLLTAQSAVPSWYFLFFIVWGNLLYFRKIDKEWLIFWLVAILTYLFFRVTEAQLGIVYHLIVALPYLYFQLQKRN